MLTYDTPALRQTGRRNLTGQKTLPTIWGTYMRLVTKYLISAINSCWEKCVLKWTYTKCMFNVHKISKAGKQEVWISRIKKLFPQHVIPIWSLWPNIRFLSSIVADEKCAYMLNVYKNQLSRQTGCRNLTGPKALPTIWHTYMRLVTKYQIPVINSCWENVTKNVHICSMCIKTN